jgi:hypothetical protein
LEAGGLAFGEGDAAGEGLEAGLELPAGALSVVPVGEGDTAGDGLVVWVGVGVSLGSVAHPAANMIENVARSRSAVRLIKLMLEFFIIFPHSNKIEKRDDDCAVANWEQREFPQRFRRSLRFRRN